MCSAQSEAVINYKIEWITFGYHKVYSRHTLVLSYEICIAANDIIIMSLEENISSFATWVAVSWVRENNIIETSLDDSDS